MNVWFRCSVDDYKEILPDVLAAIGKTPMVRLKNLPKSLNIKCEVCKYVFRALQ